MLRSSLPETLGAYRVLRRLSEGGMGAVLLGRREGSRGFEKLVAIKVLLPQLVDSDDAKDLFFSEARLAARLNHPNVCQVFDFGQEHELYFLVMEYIDGVSVQDLLQTLHQRGERMPPELVCRLVADAARGLHHAHTLRDENGQALGVVHRDVSPQNILVTFDGHCKVLDFGIAKSRERVTTTEMGIVRGKPAYMSPEQTRAEPLDARSDLFSLGTVLWELLVGDSLFIRDNIYATITAIANDPIVDPRQRVEGFTDALAEIALRALQRNPSQRFASADEMARALEAWIVEQGKTATSAELADFVRARFERSESPLPTPSSKARTPGQHTQMMHGAQESTPSRSQAPYPEELPTAGLPIGRVSQRLSSSSTGFVSNDDTGNTGQLVTSWRRTRLLPTIATTMFGLALVAALLWFDVIPSFRSNVPAATTSVAQDAGDARDATEIAHIDLSVAMRADVGADTTPVHDTVTAVVEPSRRAKKPVRTKTPRRRTVDKPDATTSKPVPASASTRYGKLTVRTDPFANVLVDGKPLGITPMSRKLTTGQHVVEIIAADTGKVWHREEITIIEGVEKRIVLKR